MSRQRRLPLFATAQCGEHLIKIYVNPALRGCNACTRWWPSLKRAPWIELQPKIVYGKRRWLESILVHEFTHVIERIHAFKLARPDPEGCSQLAIVVERYLTQLMRTFERV